MCKCVNKKWCKVSFKATVGFVSLYHSYKRILTQFVWNGLVKNNGLKKINHNNLKISQLQIFYSAILETYQMTTKWNECLHTLISRNAQKVKKASIGWVIVSQILSLNMSFFYSSQLYK